MERAMQKTVLIEVGDYSDADLPKNANDLLAFWEAELQKVPAEYRQSAEIKRFNASFEGDWDDWRTTLEYPRLETPDEAAKRVAREKVAGTTISITNDRVTIAQDGVVRVRIGNLEKPFTVDGDQVFLNNAFVRDGTVETDPLSANWRVTMQPTAKGQYVAAGIGLGSQILTAADKFAIKEEQHQTPFEKALAEGDARKILDMITGTISEAALGETLSAFNDYVRSVLRDELRPGGLLHRS
jgi:hypothetical protein